MRDVWIPQPRITPPPETTHTPSAQSAFTSHLSFALLAAQAQNPKRLGELLLINVGGNNESFMKYNCCSVAKLSKINCLV